VQRLSHLPIIVDPSHGTGKRNKVIPMARAAVAVGADGVMVEVHNDPDHALSDGMQSIFPDQFDGMMGEIRQIAAILHRNVQEPQNVPQNVPQNAPMTQPAVAKAGR
jgi:3-deoxy-7-phosphoheptulonate synthase